MSDGTLIGRLRSVGTVRGSLSAESLEGTLTTPKVIFFDDYERLKNLPKIEGNTLIGDKSFPELGLDTATFLEIEEILQS